MRQEFYWVIGTGTDVGKTTMATALLRILNRRRYPAVGFKPYSATLLPSLVDDMWDADPADRGRIFGSDARNLAKSSPLTAAADLECIVPVQYICHPTFHSALLARVGSRTIGDKILVRSDHQLGFLDRPDIIAFFDRHGIAMADMASADHLKLSSCPGHSQGQVEKSFRHLTLRDDVAAAVCEGIGQFLPLWGGMPLIDHIIHIGMSTVRFFPNVGLSLDGRRHETLQTGKMIDHLLTNGGSLSAPLPLAPSSRREQIAEEVLDGLLHAAGLAQ